MTDGNLDNIVLALLFSADEPLSLRKMASLLQDTPTSDIRDALERWRKLFDDDSWSIVLEKVAGGFQLSSRPEYAPYIARLYSGRRKLRLSKAALETLAIIAYKQPITRADIEAIRGVGCGSVVSNLLERSLVRITGKAKVLGAPFLYGTTQEFLEYLGLNSLRDLPSMEELEALLEREEAAAEETGAAEPSAAADSGSAVGEDLAEEEDEIDREDEFVEVGPAGAGSARRGPDIEEPYHRPLGEAGEVPPFSDETPAPGADAAGRSRPRGGSEQTEDTPQESDDDSGPEEDPSHAAKE
jgi:segregation and condensation protein B